MAASKLLNIRNSALHNLIRCRLLHPSASAAAAAAASNLLPSTSNESVNVFLLRNGDVKSPWHSSNAYFPQWTLGSSLIQIEAARTYVTRDDLDYEDPDSIDDDDDDDDDDEDDDDNVENYSGSDFDDEDGYEDTDQNPDTE